jgi:hypothetical protein
MISNSKATDFRANAQAKNRKDAEAAERKLKVKAKEDIEERGGPATARLFFGMRPGAIRRKLGSTIATARALRAA